MKWPWSQKPSAAPQEPQGMSFDNDECYRLMLAMDAYLDPEDGFSPATAGEEIHLRGCQALAGKLRRHYDARRAFHGRPPIYTRDAR